ncbi:carboxymuconolactone decarboxylase family protein [Chitinophaga nivalis]|uniref:Carboxymuconolactone decarboxylase family protein n=1 Tax=Chitinophaga nivalis TaxID=2991709 RepID=A0ABT3IMC6_9BACT|nr:carboxymuconolactone decarboxylase family protein [Chitinophaga nivalis]MCW3465210.1 carboxymuconolactone decarboxylase family protein [Chitinophaga nivalis]MCW3485098.1 carboxymuconolactone decarboxylase family protein [Chitinophaga nivalis]
MNKRIRIKQLQPEAYQVMFAFEKYLSETNLTPIQQELIRIRASQINGCAYCVNAHTKDARGLGETETRLYALPVWRETPFFTPEERALLALTEEVTNIQHGGVSEATYQDALQHFGEKTLAQLIMAIIAINAWNRIGVSTGMMPEVD